MAEPPQDDVTGGSHLSERERLQLALEPAKDAVLAYLEQCAEADAHLGQVGIGRDPMCVWIQWAGGPPSLTVWRDIQAIRDDVGYPIHFVATKLSSLMAVEVQERFIAEPAVVSAGFVDEAFSVGVTADLAGRPHTVEVDGQAIPVNYHLSDFSAFLE